MLVPLAAQLLLIVAFALPLMDPDSFLPGMDAEALKSIILIEWLVLLGGLLFVFAVYGQRRRHRHRRWEDPHEYGDFGDFGDGDFAESPSAPPKVSPEVRIMWRRFSFVGIAILLAALAFLLDGPRGALALLVLWIATFGGPLFGFGLSRDARERSLWRAFARWWICLFLMVLVFANHRFLGTDPGGLPGLLYFTTLAVLDLAHAFWITWKQAKNA